MRISKIHPHISLIQLRLFSAILSQTEKSQISRHIIRFKLREITFPHFLCRKTANFALCKACLSIRTIFQSKDIMRNTRIPALRSPLPRCSGRHTSIV